MPRNEIHEENSHVLSSPMTGEVEYTRREAPDSIAGLTGEDVHEPDWNDVFAELRLKEQE